MESLMRPTGRNRQDVSSWAMEKKVDGHSGQIIIDREGHGHCYTATRDVTDLLPPLFYPSLRGTVLHVEWCAGKRSTSAQVSSFLSKDGWKKVEEPRVVILHVLVFQGRNVRPLVYTDNIIIREQVAKMLIGRWAIKTEVPATVLHSESAKVGRLEAWKAEGAEGAVYKRKDAPYTGGYSRDWVKHKFDNTLDAWVFGYLPGNGKYKGLIGSLYLALVDKNGKFVTIGRTGGMTDVVRKELTERLDKGEQFAVEVKYERWTNGDRLRHPRFLRVRDDLTTENCTVEVQAPHFQGGSRA